MAGKSFAVSPVVLIDGNPVPATNWSVDLTAYSMTSALAATVWGGTAAKFAALPDFGALMQSKPRVPIQILASYSQDGKGAIQSLESGYLDSRETDYERKTIAFTARGEASVFQDIQVTAPIDRSQAGSAIIEKFFAQAGIPLNAVTTSPTYAGKTAGDPVYNITARARTAWDEMQAIALADGMQLIVHNGVGTYGPPGTGPGLHFNWGQGNAGGGWLTSLRVRHSPRRSHNIKVVLTSRLRLEKKGVIQVQYGSGSADGTETFNFATSGLTREQAKARAQQIYFDLARKEHLVTAVVAPDEQLISTIASVGANFHVQLGGDIAASDRLVYGVRQVRLDFSTQRTNLPLLATLTMGNVNPINEGAFLS